MKKVSDINVTSINLLPTPIALLQTKPKTEQQADFIADSREVIQNIILRKDKRQLLIVGPCSIHHIPAAKEYAEKLADLAQLVSDRIYILMRTYFEKPRTSIGWKGLIMDPFLDGSCNIPIGLTLAREFLQHVIDLKLPTATELLDPITPQYIADLVSWSAIGARTTESQTHRQMASGLSMPLGFKNSTDGNIASAINAIKAAIQPQTFLGINQEGIASALTTKGNPFCHLILRGGHHGPNYSSEDIQNAVQQLQSHKLNSSILIDCSHANSGKDHNNQRKVLHSIADEIIKGNDSVLGAMLESNLKPGNQIFPQECEKLKYGVSITDPCLGWEDTVDLIQSFYRRLEDEKVLSIQSPIN